MSIYKLIFNGELLESCDKNVCIERLAKLFKKSPQDIEKGLFSGKAIVVKKTDDRKVVDNFVKAFQEAGAKLIVEEDQPEPLSDEPAHPFEEELSEARKKQSAAAVLKNKKDKTAPPSSKKRTWMMIGIMLFILIIFGTGGGGYWWVQKRILTVNIPQAVIETENALTTKNLIALGYGNVEKAVALETMFFDQPDDKALIDIQDDSLMNQLLAEGIDPRKTIQQALFSIHLEGDSLENANGYFTIVLLGQFNPDQVKEFIEGAYEIQSSADNGRLLVFRKQNIDDCSYSPTRCLYADNTRIVVTSPVAMADLLNRMDHKAPAEIDLGNWRKYRENMLVSLGLFAPDHVDKAAKGLIAMMLAQLKEELGSIQSGFAGVKPVVLPPGVKLDIALNAEDQSWINAEAEKLQKMIDGSKANFPTDMPSVASLYDHLKIISDPGQFRIEFLLNKKLFDNIGEVFGEFMGALFPGGSSAPDNSMSIDQEQLAQSPTRFYASYDVSRLKPFNTIEDIQFKPDWTDGPFGISIEQLKYNENQEIEITLKAEARQIENLGKDSKRISFEVTSVTNSVGEELLKEETCGRDRNTLPVYFSGLFPGTYFKDGKMISYEKANAEKKIRLKSGVQLTDVAQLNGIITLVLPTSTERFAIKAPFKDHVVQDEAVRVRFKEGSKHQLVYESSGKQDNILSVRGLNKDQKVLACMGSFSMDRFIGSGKSTTTDYQGTVEYAEVFLVKKSQQKQYPFSLPTVLPVQDTPNGTYTYMPLGTYSLALYSETVALQDPPQQIELDSWRGKPDGDVSAGPFRMQLFDFRVSTHWGSSVMIDIYCPAIPSVNENLSALNVEFNEAVLPDGISIPFHLNEYIKVRHAGGYVMNGVYHFDEKNNYLKGQQNLSFDYKGDRPVSVNGRLTLMLPLSLSTIEVSSLNLGDVTSEGGYKIMVNGIGRGNMDFAIEGDRNRIITFRMYDANGDGLGASVYDLEKQGGKWLAHVTFNGTPAKMIMHIADQVETKSYPLQVELQEDAAVAM